MGTPNYDDCTEDQLLSLDIPTLRSDTDNFLLLESVISKFLKSISLCDLHKNKMICDVTVRLMTTGFLLDKSPTNCSA